MPIDRTEYSTAFQVPELLQRDTAGRVTCPIYRNGALVAPSSAAYAIIKPDGSELVSGAGTIVSDVAGVTIAPATIAGEPYQMGYRIIWDLTIASEDHKFRNELGIVRYAPYCPVSDADLLARHSGLDRNLRAGVTSWQPHIDEAWYQLQRWLLQKGNRPHLIVQSSDIKDLATVWALVVIFKDLATLATTEDRNYRLRNEYMEELDKLKKEIQFSYSSTDNEIPERRQRPASPITFLGGHGGRDGYGWRGGR